MSVILNMIVRNEERVLPRCLASVAPYIDSWVIADTGSTDGTLKILKEFQLIKPGHIYNNVWIDYGQSRTEALNQAKKHAKDNDYLFFIDADETFEAPKNYKFPELTEGCYEIAMHHGNLVYWRPGLVKAGLPWLWQDPVHEYITCKSAVKHAKLSDIYRLTHPETDTRDGRVKFTEHAKLLEAAINRDPKNTRYWFYLAQSYKDAGDFAKSLETYEKRATMSGWDEENYISLLFIARLKMWMGKPPQEVAWAFMRAYQFRPTRAEALGGLARHLRLSGLYEMATLCAEEAAAMPVPNDRLFVETDWYDWRGLDEFSINSYYVGRYKDSLDACDELLKKELPVVERERIMKNRGFALAKVNA